MHGQTLHDAHLELHGAQLVENVAHVVTDDRPRDAVVALGCCLDDVAGHVVEGDHVTQHANGLVERAESKDRDVALPMSKDDHKSDLLVYYTILSPGDIFAPSVGNVDTFIYFIYVSHLSYGE